MTILFVSKTTLGPILFLLPLACLSFLIDDEQNERVEESSLSVRALVVQEEERKNPTAPRSCYEDRMATAFQSSLVINYQARCGNTLPQSDLTLLSYTILSTYNEMLATEYCDPFSRQLSNITYSTSLIEADTKIGSVVEFGVAGTCHGCESGWPLFHEIGREDLHHSSTGNRAGTSLEEAVKEKGRLLSHDDLTCCPTLTMSIRRAPTEKEFLQVYESALLKYSDDLICMIPPNLHYGDQLVSTLLPSSASAQSPRVLLDCTTSSLTTALTSEVVVKLNENGATQSSLEELGQDIIRAYNGLMNATYIPCAEPQYRQITNISVVTSTLSRRNMRSRSLQDLSTTETIFRLDGGCRGCDSESMFFDPDIASSDDFVAYYSDLVDGGLANINEIEILDCPSNSTMFQNWIMIEFVPNENLNSDSLLNNEVLIQQLQEFYVKTYNELALEYCDPHSRYLQSVNITFVGSRNVYGNIPVELRVIGTCDNCNRFDMDVFDVPSNSSSVQASRRYLPSSSERAISSLKSLCYCPARPIAYRGPFEAEFLDAYRSAVNNTGAALVDMDPDTQALFSVAECGFGTTFQSVIYVKFLATREDFNNTVRGDIEDALQESINTLYANNETTCNPQFRTVDSVTSSFVSSSSSRRTAQSLQNRHVQELSPPSAAPSRSPAPSLSAAPSTSLMPSTLDVQFPTLYSSSTDLYLYVSGVCNECSNPITRGDQTVDSRNLQATADQFREATSNCFCQIGATIDATAPTIDQLRDLFVQNLREVGITFVILDFREIPPTSPSPTEVPSSLRTPSPTPEPTAEPTLSPTPEPTLQPTPLPTLQPTPLPTLQPTPLPTLQPSPLPTLQPTPLPTSQPTPLPTSQPTPLPTLQPTPLPTLQPTPLPTLQPTPLPTLQPTPLPTSQPTPLPTLQPTPLPTLQPTPLPTSQPTPLPTLQPTPLPTLSPSSSPSSSPSFLPTNDCSLTYSCPICRTLGPQFECGSFLLGDCDFIDVLFEIYWKGDDNLELSVQPPGGQSPYTGRAVRTWFWNFGNGTSVPITTLGIQNREVYLQNSESPAAGTYKVCVTNNNQVGEAEPFFLYVEERDFALAASTGIVLAGEQRCIDYSYPGRTLDYYCYDPYELDYIGPFP